MDGWRFKGQQINRSRHFQNLLLDMTFQQVAENLLPFALHRGEKCLNSGDAGYGDRPWCDASQRLAVLERIEKCLQGLLPEEEEYDDASRHQ